MIKTLYLIRHAKSTWKSGKQWDFMRGLSKRGLNDLETMSSYMALRHIEPDLILSSCALRTQMTADKLAEKVAYTDDICYMDELYLTNSDMVLNVLSTQDDKHESIFYIGHNPALTELVNGFIEEEFSKFPTLGIFALKLDIDSWKDILDQHNAEIDFFTFPKQFKYYVPKHIKSVMDQEL